MLDIGLGLCLATSAFVLIALTWSRKYWRKSSHTPLPPGPPALPLVGSIFSLNDRSRIWLSFTAWRSTYGDIIYARMLNKHIVVINSEEVAKDLFEVRSNIYSDKPQSIVYKYFATDFNMAVIPYGDRWRLHRRVIHQQFRPATLPIYHPVLLRSARKVLFRFLQDPTGYISHIQSFICSHVLAMVYDHETKGKDDHIANMVHKYEKLVVSNVTPGRTLIMEMFPFLLHLPTWFPGATFKRASVQCIQASHDMKETPFQCIKEKMSKGSVPRCLVADAMNNLNGFENEATETAIKEAASVAFLGASETTTGMLLSFLLAMALYPEVQAKAQADIGRVIGWDRLPDFDDRPVLPYVDAILRETLRWYPAFPMGAPHATITSDVYKGYFIPKGVVVIANIWAMTHDENKYPEPNEFRPERFLHEDGSLTSDKMNIAFGRGRRTCVGQHLADASMWIVMASFLATFSIHKAFDEHGHEIPIIPKYTTGFTIHPEEFPCRIVPRFRGGSVEKLAQLTGLSPWIN